MIILKKEHLLSVMKSNICGFDKEDEIEYLGICIYGQKKKINKLTGSLKMLR